LIPSIGRVLGIDLGSRRVGVAISDSGQTVASGLTVVLRSDAGDRYRQELAELVAEEGAVGAVVGLPLSLDGTVGPAARSALAEVEALRALLDPAGGVAVEMCDERFTTVSAARALRAGGRRPGRARQVVDAVAATVVLQSWLDRRRAAPAASRGPESGYR
jgi:putative Holliday junction resolvase